MDINAEVSTQLSLIDALLSDLQKPATSCANKKNEKKQEDNQDAMPDSTTNSEKTTSNTFNCGDDVLVPNKDGRYYLGTIVELSTSNDNDSCEVGASVARCLVKYGDGTHAWASISSLKLLSVPPADDGRIMCVVCKRRDTAGLADNAIIACDMCGRGYHAKCHTPPVDSWSPGVSWYCKRCVDQRYKLAAAENRALKRSDFFRFKVGQQRRQQDMTPCDTASTTSSTSDFSQGQDESHCYCGDSSDWLAQMLHCCRCTRLFHQRCVSSLQYPLYAGDKLYIFSCSDCNGGKEYLRRLELCWLDLAHLVLYNLTVYNAPNYFDLDTVIMPYIMDNWHALQLPDKMWRTPSKERREKILTALTSSRKRFKCGREMKKRATIWGLRLRRPPSTPSQLQLLEQIKKGEALTDDLVHEFAPRLRFLPRAPSPTSTANDSCLPSSSKVDKSSYNVHPKQQMIVPLNNHWLTLMTGKRFHENLNSNSENDSTSSYESTKQNEADESVSNPVSTNTKELTEVNDRPMSSQPQVPSINSSIMQCSVQLDILDDTAISKTPESISINTHSSRIATMNLELSKLSTKNIIEHSKILSLQQDSAHSSHNGLYHDMESSGDETSSRGALDAIIPPLKNFQGNNNPFLMQNSRVTKTVNPYTKNIRLPNGKKHHSRFLFPAQTNSLMGPMVRPLKRKLSEKDIIIGPNGEVKRRKLRRPRKYIQVMNKSTEDAAKGQVPSENGEPGDSSKKFQGRRLRQRQEKNYYENTRRNVSAPTSNNNSVKSLQLSPHKNNSSVGAQQLSALKSSVQSYFRAEQTFHILARRMEPGNPPQYLIEWDPKT